jgi:hypothetical protein
MGQRLAAVSLEAMHERLERTRARRIEGAEQRLEALARQLSIVGPMSVLRRGFSYTLREDGSLVKSPADVRAGERIRTRLAEGEVASVVEGDGSGSAAGKVVLTPVAAARPKPILGGTRRRKRPDSPDQMDLFAQGR